MRKSEFILAGKRYEIVDAIIEKMGRSILSSNEYEYIASRAKFFENFIEIEIFFEYYENDNECCIDSYKKKISYDDLEF